MNSIERMREEWDRRAKQDAHFYVAFVKEQQDEEGFRASAAENMPALVQEFPRLAETDPARRKALEIGCGPGRLMGPVAEHFGEIHGVDISEEMLTLARKRLAKVPGARFHLVSGDNLTPLPDNSFDFAYSYAVFQHIPDREAVLSYLREAHRVLKPGGLLRCQVRGVAAIPSEMKYQSDTWTGCHFTAQEMAEFAKAEEFPLMDISGIGTQYMWTTFQKLPRDVVKRDPYGALLRAVTNAIDASSNIPLRGRGAALSLWIANLPGDADLSSFSILFNGIPQMGCYLSPIDLAGHCQLNARLPTGLAVGPVKVQLAHGGQPFGAIHEIHVTESLDTTPNIVKVSDGINMRSLYRVETGGAKVTIENVQQPESVAFLIDGQRLTLLEPVCSDPTTDTYQFAFFLPRGAKGRSQVTVEIGGRALAKFDLEVVGTRD